MDELVHDSFVDGVNLHAACVLIQDTKIDTAITMLYQLLDQNYEDGIVANIIKATLFWKNRKNVLENMYVDFEKGKYLLTQWQLYQDKLRELEITHELYLYSIRQYVFGSALNYFLSLLDIYTDDSDLLLCIGRSYKGKGDYAHAIEYFEEVRQIDEKNSEVLSELADCYALIDEEQLAKLFFREAFFINPQKILIDFMISELFWSVYYDVARRLHSVDIREILEWMPVYGVIMGVFVVKRELRPIEYSKLRQTVHSMERDLHDQRESEYMLVPRLLNKYFWIIDYYLMTKEDKNKIEQILLKIKSIDNTIYDLYTS